jgi:hypothetical protein
VRRSRRLLVTLLAVFIPGYGLLSYRRVIPAVLVLSAGAALAAAAAGLATPFSYETRLAIPVQEVPLAVLVGSALTLYAISIFGYVGSRLRADATEAAKSAPVRSRIRLTGRDHTALAA